jgi:hypothetical protein
VLLGYKTLTGLDYYGELPEGYQLFTTEGTNGPKLQVPINQVDVFASMDDFYDELISPNEPTEKPTHAIWLDDFLISGILDQTNGISCRVLQNAEEGSLGVLQEELDLHVDDNVLLIGKTGWFELLHSKGVLKDNHYCMYMPKQQDLMDKAQFRNIKQIAVYVTTEVGIVGYRYSWCSPEYKVGNQYHFVTQRHNLYGEVVDYELVVTYDNTVFPFIRYSQGDEVSESDWGACDCGAPGGSFQHVGRVV